MRSKPRAKPSPVTANYNFDKGLDSNISRLCSDSCPQGQSALPPGMPSQHKTRQIHKRSGTKLTAPKRNKRPANATDYRFLERRDLNLEVAHTWVVNEPPGDDILARPDPVQECKKL